jgi:hypothetical protein
MTIQAPTVQSSLLDGNALSDAYAVALDQNWDGRNAPETAAMTVRCRVASNGDPQIVLVVDTATSGLEDTVWLQSSEAVELAQAILAVVGDVTEAANRLRAAVTEVDAR